MSPILGVPPLASFLPPASRSDIRHGIIYMVAAVFLFAVLNAAIKWQVARYPVGEVIFVRCLFALIPCFVLVSLSGGLRVLRTRRLGWHVSRAMLQYVSMSCSYMAFGLMPLADAVAIGFASPIFLTALSVPLLGEKVGVYRWGAVAFGFVGVMIMVRPSGDVLNSGAIFALTNALLGALLSIGIRRLSATESSATLVFYQAVTTFALACATLPFYDWVPMRWGDFLMIGAIGVCSGIAQFWWTQAFRFCPAAILAPFSYLSMIWAVLMGFLVWGDVPTLALLGGAAMVVASGLFIAYREMRRRGAASPPAKPSS